MVIDINALAPVFNCTCSRHEHFAPVKAWIDAGRGFIVFGGTRYKRELSAAYRYLLLVQQLRVAGKAVAIRDDVVDAAETVINGRTVGTDCDDQHIIALLGVSGCGLLCSDDCRSFKFIRDRTLFPKGARRVRIYSGLRNQRLLVRLKPDGIRHRV